MWARRVPFAAMSTVFTLLLSGVFAMAALSKLRDPEPFAQTVTALLASARKRSPHAGNVSHVPTPTRFGTAIARAVPVAEMALAALLISGVAPRAAALAVLMTLVAFSAALVRLRRDPSLPACNCFGTGDGDTRAGLVRNGVLAVLALLTLASPIHGPVWGTSASTLAGAVTVCVGTVCLWTLGRTWAGTRTVTRA